VLKNETWATNGARGVSLIPRPFEHLPEPWNQLALMGLVLAIVALLYVLLEQARRAPWGRVMAAIRENEAAARAAGKNVDRLRVQAFVIGSMVMGLGGALMAHYLKFIDPNAAEPLTATFLVWVMLIVGGSANNRGAILGALLIWAIWSATEILTTRLPDELAIRTAYVRVFLIGLMLQIVLQRFPSGILPERRMTAGAQGEPTTKPVARRDVPA
jgi:branched-chain amino acid transport system permease protein